MTFSAQTAQSEKGHSAATWRTMTKNVSSLGAALKGYTVKTLSVIQTVLKTVQTARMVSTLSYMSDAQLEQLGISRNDIPQYARKLMADE